MRTAWAGHRASGGLLATVDRRRSGAGGLARTNGLERHAGFGPCPRESPAAPKSIATSKEAGTSVSGPETPGCHLGGAPGRRDPPPPNRLASARPAGWQRGSALNRRHGLLHPRVGGGTDAGGTGQGPTCCSPVAGRGGPADPATRFTARGSDRQLLREWHRRVGSTGPGVRARRSKEGYQAGVRGSLPVPVRRARSDLVGNGAPRLLPHDQPASRRRLARWRVATAARVRDPGGCESPWEHRALDRRQRRTGATDSPVEQGPEVDDPAEARPAATSSRECGERVSRSDGPTARGQRSR
jgi:hypothetical protein